MDSAMQSSSEYDDQAATEEGFVSQRGGKDASSGRRLQLVRLLTAQNCTREDIFQHLKDYYVLDYSSHHPSFTLRW
jgi:hypothetical protein